MRRIGGDGASVWCPKIRVLGVSPGLGVRDFERKRAVAGLWIWDLGVAIGDLGVSLNYGYFVGGGPHNNDYCETTI